MCATYVIKAQKDVLRNRYGVSLPEDFEGIDERIVPFAKAPVIVNEIKDPILKPMQFSLIPTWSKDRKPKFATFNARVEDIETKPTWKVPFQKFHCIVPISNFIEPIYTGEYAGNMVSFKSDSILNAAGIYNSWIDKATGETIDSFALIMQDALPFVAKVGHERSPIFLSDSNAKAWLNNEGSAPLELKAFLKQSTTEPDLGVSVDRAMAKGWEKRIPKDG